MTPAALRALLAGIPAATVPEPAALPRLVDAEAAYLASARAHDQVRADPYWPKWDSPWWRMLTLHELGRADRIPRAIADAMVARLAALPVHDFPIHDHDWPPGVDRRRDAMCMCAIGCIDGVLAACGIDVDRELPWFAAWFTRYQLGDGGYNCDETAYRVTGEHPSSMVATVPLLEAMARRPPSAACDRAAAAVLGRELRLGSPTAHNAEERVAAAAWPALSFPRFYFYDVLRGLAAVVTWATAHGRALPAAAIAPVVAELARAAPDGVVRVGRAAFTGARTLAAGDGWTGRHPAAITPLCAAVSEVGAPSAWLTRQWTATRRALAELVDAGRVS